VLRTEPETAESEYSRSIQQCPSYIGRENRVRKTEDNNYFLGSMGSRPSVCRVMRKKYS
jgi:hypothetical protein